MLASNEEMGAVRKRFYDAARTMYPKVPEPGTVWVLTEVLGWDWDQVKDTLIEGFSRQGYRRRQYHVTYVNKDEPELTQYAFTDGAPVVVTREWTREEKRKLNDWWWLLGF